MPKKYGFAGADVPEKLEPNVIRAPSLDGLLDLLRIPLAVERLLCQSRQFRVANHFWREFADVFAAPNSCPAVISSWSTTPKAKISARLSVSLPRPCRNVAPEFQLGGIRQSRTCTGR